MPSAFVAEGFCSVWQCGMFHFLAAPFLNLMDVYNFTFQMRIKSLVVRVNTDQSEPWRDSNPEVQLTVRAVNGVVSHVGPLFGVEKVVAALDGVARLLLAAASLTEFHFASNNLMRKNSDLARSQWLFLHRFLPFLCFLPSFILSFVLPFIRP